MSTAPEDLKISPDLKLLGPKVLGDVIAKFLEHASLQRAAIEQAIGRSDATALKDSSHSLKGSASTVGLERIAEICSELEMAARQGSVAGAPERFEVLTAELERAREFLDGLSANLESGSPV